MCLIIGKQNRNDTCDMWCCHTCTIEGSIASSTIRGSDSYSWSTDINFISIVRKIRSGECIVYCSHGKCILTCRRHKKGSIIIRVSCCCNHNSSRCMCIIYRCTDRMSYMVRSSTKAHIDDIDSLICCVDKRIINSIGRTDTLSVTNLEWYQFYVTIHAIDTSSVCYCSYRSCYMGTVIMIVCWVCIIIHEIISRDGRTDIRTNIWMGRINSGVNNTYGDSRLLMYCFLI